MRIVRRIVVIALIVFTLLISGFVVWANTPAGALLPEAEAALVSTDAVTVATTPMLTFTPTQTTPTTGFIFYPGGRVPPSAYAPYGQAIAEQGYLVVMPSMPLQLAVLNPNAALDIMAAHPDIQDWVVGGHSLGGAMAANFAHNHADSVDGVVLWASFAQASDSLADSGLDVVSIYGTLDGLATPEKIQEAREALPADTVYVAVEGGNHAQFGWYGEQAGDNPATLSREDHMAQTVAATTDLLARVGQ